jgi:predicted Zn-dependent protease
MWSPPSTKRWIRISCPTLGGVVLLAALAGCSVTPRHAAQPRQPVPAVARAPGAGKTGAAGKATQPGSGQSGAVAAGPQPIPAQAKAEFDRAVSLAKAGNGAAAETQFASLAQQYPQFSTPLVDLGILYRKSGNLDAAAQALQQAVARDPHSALAWTELGVTQRLGGKFKDAEQSYGQAIAADPAYAPAYRDRGVLRDLYLDQPAAALGDFEQYRKLASGDKPAAMWVAELQHRTGIKAPPAAQTSPAQTQAPAAQTPAATAGVASPTPARAGAAPTPPPQARN